MLTVNILPFRRAWKILRLQFINIDYVRLNCITNTLTRIFRYRIAFSSLSDSYFNRK